MSWVQTSKGRYAVLSGETKNPDKTKGMSWVKTSKGCFTVPDRKTAEDLDAMRTISTKEVRTAIQNRHSKQDRVPESKKSRGKSAHKNTSAGNRAARPEEEEIHESYSQDMKDDPVEQERNGLTGLDVSGVNNDELIDDKRPVEEDCEKPAQQGAEASRSLALVPKKGTTASQEGKAAS